MRRRYKVKTIMVRIDPSLKNKIKALQKRIQQKENLKYGRKAKSVTFGYASKEVAKRI